MKLANLLLCIALFLGPVQVKSSVASSEKDVYVTFTSSTDSALKQGIYRYTRMTSYFNRPAIYFHFVNKDTGVNECLVFYDYKQNVVNSLTFNPEKYMMSTTHIPVSSLEKVKIINLDALLSTWTREEAYQYFWSLNDKTVWVIDKSNVGEDPSNPLVIQTMPGVFYKY